MDKVIVLTGADGGLGKIFIRKFLNMPAVRVVGIGLHAQPLDFLELIDTTRYEHHLVDITKEFEVSAIACKIPLVDWLVNCAGVELKLSFASERTIAAANIEMSVNFLGTNNISYHFYEKLKKSPEAKLVNILSIAALAPIIELGAYSASKAAAHVLTLCQRQILSKFGISVHGVYPGWIKVGMGEAVYSEEKLSPDDVVGQIIDAVLNGDESIFPDAMSQRIVRENPHLVKFPII